jgi:hypothetical protein
MRGKPNQTKVHVVRSREGLAVGEGEIEPNQTNLHIVKNRQEPAGGEWKERMKPNQQLHLKIIWYYFLGGKTKPNQVARGLELGPLGEENQTKPSCTWCGVGASG